MHSNNSNCLGISDIENVLRSVRGKQVVFLPNPGNAGDSFIAHATYQLFQKIGLDYEMGDPQRIYANRVVILGGGGNLVEPYKDVANVIDRNVDRVHQLIILPHTIRSHIDVVSRLKANCVVFCREMPTYRFVKEAAPAADVLLGHDMALSCDLPATRELGSRDVRTTTSPSLLLRNLKRVVRSSLYHMKWLDSGKTLNSIRLDMERTSIPVPVHNIDLSAAFAADDMSPQSSLHATYFMLRFIDRFNVVRTNRLHVAIMSALLQKAVHMSDNSYGKNYDVFQHSIGDFRNVRWEE
ncbi:polysaccharide pyruvyl transferase family protein [Bradyrhizobium sp. AZCC 2230]|uniref:polysaccharide pyruvyl transferase family protein n=1 Tax=Bradyrhizobium sp. AZCC 2230 TaxID=3117021 RepID=UPI002FF0185E